MSENSNKKIKIENSEHPAFANAKNKIEKLNNQPIVKGAQEQYTQFTENESVKQAKEKASHSFRKVKNVFSTMVLGKNPQPNPSQQNFDHNQGLGQTQQNLEPNQGQFQGQQNFDANQGQFQGQQNFNPNQGQVQTQQNLEPNQGQFQGQQNFDPNQGQQNFDPNQGQFQGQPPFPTNQSPVAKFFSNTRNLALTIGGIVSVFLLIFFLTGESGGAAKSKPEDTIKAVLTSMKEEDYKTLIETVHYKTPEEKTEVIKDIAKSKYKSEVAVYASLMDVKVVETTHLTDNKIKVKVEWTPSVEGYENHKNTSTTTLIKVDGKWKFDGEDALSDLFK